MFDLHQLTDELQNQGYSVIDSFLPGTTHDALLHMAKKMAAAGEFKPARIGRQLDTVHNQTIRRDHIRWLDKTPEQEAIQAYYTAIDVLAKGLNEAFYLGLVHFETHFAIYQPGDFYRKHRDQFITTQDRRISCVYYLNTGWQAELGGELKLYDTADQLLQTILPHGNRFVCFESHLPHEVCETHQYRYSLAGWLKTRSTVIA